MVLSWASASQQKTKKALKESRGLKPHLGFHSSADGALWLVKRGCGLANGNVCFLQIAVYPGSQHTGVAFWKRSTFVYFIDQTW